jgi:hypothetical protein
VTDAPPRQSGRHAAPAPDRLFAPGVAFALVAAAVVSAALFLVLTAYAPELRNTSDGRAHALSTSAVGYAGLAELARASGMTATVSHDPRPSDGQSPSSVFVLTPEVGAPAEGKALLLAPGEKLIVPPKWVVAPAPLHPGWVVRLDAYSPVFVDGTMLAPLVGRNWPMSHRASPSRPVLFGRGGPFPDDVRIPLGRIEAFRTFSGLPAGWLPALVDEQGRTVLAEKADSPVYVLSDPDLLDNQGLAEPDNAKAALYLLHALPAGAEQPVVFDVSLDGFARSRDILRLIFEPPFLAATLCVLGAALLMGLHAAVRFGAPRPPARALAFGKRALAETSAGLIRLGGRQPAMAPRYADLTRDWAARRLGVARSQDEAAVDAALDRIGRQRTLDDPYSLLAAEARRVRDEAGLMRSAKRLYRWRLEMTRGRS